MTVFCPTPAGDGGQLPGCRNHGGKQRGAGSQNATESPAQTNLQVPALLPVQGHRRAPAVAFARPPRQGAYAHTCQVPEPQLPLHQCVFTLSVLKVLTTLLPSADRSHLPPGSLCPPSDL